MEDVCHDIVSRVMQGDAGSREIGKMLGGNRKWRGRFGLEHVRVGECPENLASRVPHLDIEPDLVA
ncbi:hypothetical protein D3C86_2172330 [compost metagenome]